MHDYDTEKPKRKRKNDAPRPRTTWLGLALLVTVALALPVPVLYVFRGRLEALTDTLIAGVMVILAVVIGLRLVRQFLQSAMGPAAAEEAFEEVPVEEYEIPDDPERF